MATARARLQTSLLYLVTPAEPKAGALDSFLGEVLGAGVDVVQLREKEMEAGPLMRVAGVVRRRTTEAGAIFVVNDRVDVALAAGADAVHLGQDDLPTREARRQGGPALVIGLSTHSAEQVRAAVRSEADYFAVGPVHATPTKPLRPAVGYDLVRVASAEADRPFFAIGGIDMTTLEEVIEAGARRVAVLRALTESDNPGSVARRMKQRLLSAAGGAS